MKITLIFLLGLMSANAFAQALCSNSQLSPDRCSFYSECVEDKIPCGQDGYALGYGEYYCNRFRDTFENYPNDFSEKANRWRKSTALCLQQKLNSTIKSLLAGSGFFSGNLCKSIEKQAFEQHAHCYTQIENSICFLPPSDLVAIFNHRIIETDDLLFSFQAIKQMLAVQNICLKQLAGKTRDPRYRWWKNGMQGLK